MSESVSARGAVSRAEAKFTTIAEISADAIITVGSDQRITFFNHGAEEIFGWTAEEVLGEPLDILLPERFREVHRTHIADFGRAPTHARQMGDRREISGLRRNGEEFPAEASISKLQVDGERVYAVVLRDITERTRLYEQAQRAIQARDDVLSVVSHDLGNPLSAIFVGLKLLRARMRAYSDDDGLAEAVELIGESAGQLRHLIDELLHVQRLESGRDALDRRRLSAAALVRRAVDLHEPVAADRSLEVEMRLASERLPPVHADPDRVLQVFSNLIGNAIKFTPAGGTITVAAERADGAVAFSVRDTGPGIRPDDLPHVFDRFWQAQTTGRHGEGLGLAIARGIVDAHGGEIIVESEPGRGATFRFTLPVAPPRDSAD